MQRPRTWVASNDDATTRGNCFNLLVTIRYYAVDQDLSFGEPTMHYSISTITACFYIGFKIEKLKSPTNMEGKSSFNVGVNQLIQLSKSEAV